MLSEDPGIASVFHDDYRDRPNCGLPGGSSCESIYVDRTCDEGSRWLDAEVRIDSDAPPNGVHSEDPEVARSPSGRMHVLWTDGGSTGTFVHYAALESPVAPRLEVLVRDEPPATRCGLPRHVLEAIVTPATLCPNPRFQWLQDGAPIAGANDPTYEVPATTPPGTYRFSFQIICDPALLCGDLSQEAEVAVAATPPSLVTDTDIAGLLFVSEIVPNAGLRLRWGDSDPDPLGYNVYQGTIGTWYDHRGLDCHIARVPAGAVQMTRDIAWPGGSTYYLISPADCGGEGGVGSRSSGVRRPVAGSGPPCGPLP